MTLMVKSEFVTLLNNKALAMSGFEKYRMCYCIVNAIWSGQSLQINLHFNNNLAFSTVRHNGGAKHGYLATTANRTCARCRR
ncbi:hypothetical protein ECA3382A [Pectobacterium atrosepticum SCRI1043]|uniref:Uncharacterized protein n=1 Tax=Pectobacterium atrosepticum (strain SCRI 1043 / ATCC BAA-672) TaxID=218491 RepID=Q6D1R3_PECAS|nr:hypothetical protein ECA3382A [Pectobacterium atrosepticum SCRI1043]